MELYTKEIIGVVFFALRFIFSTTVAVANKSTKSGRFIITLLLYLFPLITSAYLIVKNKDNVKFVYTTVTQGDGSSVLMKKRLNLETVRIENL